MLLPKKRLRAASRAAPRCGQCGRPIPAGESGMALDDTVFHAHCVPDEVEVQAYQRLYGNRTGTVNGRRTNSRPIPPPAHRRG